MIKKGNIILVGTSHIAAQSVREVREAILREKPGIVAIELDRNRLKGLLEKKTGGPRLRDMKVIGFKAYVFTLIASYVQKKLGKIVGVSPGSEMLEAVRLAKKEKMQLALIDQDISVTLRNFSKAFTWKEKWRFFVDMFKGVFFKKSQMKQLGLENVDLSKVPSKKVVKKLINQVKVRYPSIYKVLIKDRNYIMARNLSLLRRKFPDQKIVAVVGAGHEDEILRLVDKIDSSRIEFVG